MPESAATLSGRLNRLLDEFRDQARARHAMPEDIAACDYAFCATLDETILSMHSPLREAWERTPLQLQRFGEQLAGENFFIRLEQTRHRGAAGMAALSVFHLCLLLGFQGKYRLEGKEKLRHIIDTLDKELRLLQGGRAPFAPHWQAVDTVQHRSAPRMPLFAMSGMLVLSAALGYGGLRWMLARHTHATLGPVAQVIQPEAKPASVTISLP
jgi:type VI secretion system protein ImpK